MIGPHPSELGENEIFCNTCGWRGDFESKALRDAGFREHLVHRHPVPAGEPMTDAEQAKLLAEIIDIAERIAIEHGGSFEIAADWDTELRQL